jgi:methyl-accepting chemotaxis protein
LVLAILSTTGVLIYTIFKASEKTAIENAVESMETELNDKINAINQLHEKAKSDLVLSLQYPVFKEYFELPETKRGNRYSVKNGKKVIQLSPNQRFLKNKLDQWILFLEKRYPIVETCVIDKSGQEHTRLTLGEVAPDDDFSSVENGSPFFKPTFAELKENEVHIEYPYMSPDAKKWVFCYTSPIVLKDGSMPAFFHFEIPISFFQDIIKKTASGRIFVLDPSGAMIADNKNDINIDLKKDADPEAEQKMEDYFPKADSISTYTDFGSITSSIIQTNTGRMKFTVGDIDYHVVYKKLPTFGWSIVSIKSKDELIQGGSPMQKIIKSIGITAFIALIIVIIVAIIASENISKPLREVTEITTRISEGNLSIDKHKQKIALSVISNDEISLLTKKIYMMVDKLSDIVTGVKEASDEVSSLTVNLNEATQKTSQSASRLETAGSELSSSMEQMTSGFTLNSENAKQTEAIAIKVAKGATESGDSVSESVEAMRKIVKNIIIISDIARQTNLLALNAAIEAARAGVHGDSFAVVAKEVQALAIRSRLAAKDITELSSTGLTKAENAKDMLSHLLPEIQKTSELVQEINSKSQEQGTEINSIKDNINQLDQVTGQTVEVSSEMESIVQRLTLQTEQLHETIAFFNIDNDSKIKD